MGELDNEQLLVAGPIHNNEPTANEVIKYLGQSPVQGLLAYPIPHEAPEGERYQGTSELGRHFPGDKDSDDPEDRVAAHMVSDLQPVAYWLGIDIHDSPLQNANYLAVGDITTPEQLGLAIALGLDKVLAVHDYPLFNTFPKFASVETTRDPANNPLSSSEYWHSQLGFIAAIGVHGLRRAFEQQRDRLTYYTKIAIPMVGQNALSRAHIEQLEHISVSGATFEEVEIPTEIAEVLGIKGKVARVGTWGHINNARERLELGVTHEGIQRREFFGSIYVERSGPVAIGATTLRFTWP